MTRSGRGSFAGLAAAGDEAGKWITGSVIWNLLGAGLPIVAAVLVIPSLVAGYGTDRFGVLTLAWMMVGYFSLFDLGIGRALTKSISEKLGVGEEEGIHELAWTGLGIMGLFGILGSLMILFLAPWLVGHVLKIPTGLQSETLRVLRILALAIPVVISTIGLVGILESFCRFGFVNIVRIPLGLFTFLGPLIALQNSASLVPAVIILVAVRFLSLLVYLALVFQAVPRLRGFPRMRWHLVGGLLRFGGWLTLSNIISPMMVYMDRFFIGAMVSMTAVAYYATPYSLVTKLWVIPGSLVRVLFPVFSASFARKDSESAKLFVKGNSYLFLILFPILLGFVTLAQEGLTIWLGKEFADNSAAVLQILSMGVFINCFGQVASGLVQGSGRPDLTAKLHMVELPVYLVALCWLLGEHGIIGAAVAWTGRVGLDAAALFLFAGRLLPERFRGPFRALLVKILGGLLFMLGGAFLNQTTWKILYLVLVLLVILMVGWSLFLDQGDRDWARKRLGTIPWPFRKRPTNKKIT